MSSVRLKKLASDAALMFTGTMLMALSLELFLVPNKIASGGVSGISTILFYLTDKRLPVGLSIMVINIPLFIFGITQMGREFGIKSLIGTILMSAFVDLISLKPVTTEPLLACIYGGILMGVGIGLLFRANGSTGGTDIASIIIHKRFHAIGTGTAGFMIDFVVLAAAAIFFGIEQALYALITVFVAARLIDLITEGVNSAKAYFVISKNTDAISKRVLDELDRGVTGLHGMGMYSGTDNLVLVCLIRPLEASKFRKLVHEEDPKAFVFVVDAREVLGEGFGILGEHKVTPLIKPKLKKDNNEKIS